MYRPVVSLLLLPCLLLTQPAVLSHSHSGSEPAGHDRRPHLHTTLPLPHHHEHAHHHHHGPDGHHHEDNDEPSGNAANSSTPAEPLSDDEHDSSAVYLDDIGVFLGGRIVFDVELKPSLAGAATTANLFSSVQANLRPDVVNWTHAPPAQRCCALYLWQLTLLI